MLVERTLLDGSATQLQAAARQAAAPIWQFDWVNLARTVAGRTTRIPLPAPFTGQPLHALLFPDDEQAWVCTGERGVLHYQQGQWQRERRLPEQACSSLALDANGQLEDPALQARFEGIAKDLRCLVCQNESIADFNVELASDLRRQVREMLVAGRSDAEIFDFMTDRYGEFVRFNPPVDRKTALIWGAPFIVLLLGILIIVRIVRGRSRMPLDDEASPGPL